MRIGKKRLALLAVATAVVVFSQFFLCGCFTTYRNGQVFLSTIEDYDRVVRPPTGYRGIMALFDPFIYVGSFVGMFTLGPVSDVVYLPYDIWLSNNEGTKISVVDDSLEPVAGASVRVCYHGACLSGRGNTDSEGVFRTGIVFSRLPFGWAEVEKDGYYPIKWFWRPSGGEGAQLGNFNVQTAVISRVGHPVSLRYVKARFVGDSGVVWKGYEHGKWRDLMAAGNCVGYDFIKGDWLPPFGKGETADAEFSLLQGGDESPTVRIEFKGDGNGVAFERVGPGSGVLMRLAPINGYVNSIEVSEADKSGKGLYFRTRGNTYGKICHGFGIDVFRGNGHLDNKQGKYIWSLPEKEWCTRVDFSYYLNENPCDRNLEQKKSMADWLRQGKAEP